MNSPVYCRPAAYEGFRQELATIDAGRSLFRAACAIAWHECPEADLAEAETVVENLAATVNSRTRSRNVSALLAHLHDVLFDVYGLRGNSENYYDPANSYLPSVLRRRLGIPITLVLVYKRVAEQIGLVVHGVNAPGHFLAEVAGLAAEADLVAGGQRSMPVSEPMYVDPFFGGGLLNLEEVAMRIAQTTGREPVLPLQLSRATHRQWLDRMLNNLQAALSALGQQRDVCAMQELQMLL
jgi:regulator of sirC expression with transglutaminase-like and TPR domain